MIGAISKVFGMSARPSQELGAIRQVNLSGNVFQFAMPEDFSRDMPADDLVEQLDISNPAILENPENGTLIRRWWDIKEPGFFGKKLGTVMMNISVRKVAPNTENLIHSHPFDVRDRLDFMMMLTEDTRIKHPNHIKDTTPFDENREFLYYFSGLAMLVGNDLETSYQDEVFNGQKWTRYSVAAPSSTLIVNYTIPLTRDTYLEASFYYSHNANVVARHFLRTADAKMERVLESFHIQYTDDNPVKQAVEQEWHKENPDDVIARHKQQLILPLFGPKAHFCRYCISYCAGVGAKIVF